MGDDCPLVSRLENVARRIEGTIKGQLCVFGTKHPAEVREAAARIAELEAALREIADMQTEGEVVPYAWGQEYFSRAHKIAVAALKAK
jgi:hypothetical protein